MNTKIKLDTNTLDVITLVKTALHDVMVTAMVPGGSDRLPCFIASIHMVSLVGIGADSLGDEKICAVLLRCCMFSNSGILEFNAVGLAGVIPMGSEI